MKLNLNQLFPSLKKHANTQAKLILTASLPCYFIMLYAMYLAGATWYLFFFIAISVLLIIIYATVAGRQKADYQLQTLSNLVEALIDGDYTLRGRKQSNPAFQELLDLINRLAETLNQHKLKAEESQLLLNKIIDQMEPMLIAIDEDQKISMINASAKKWLGKSLSSEMILSNELFNQLTKETKSNTIEFSDNELNGEFILFRDSFISANKKHQLFLLTRAEKLLREKQKHAWQGLFRVLSHELNNSLVPITTFSNTLKRKLDKQNAIEDIEKFKNGLSIISERADSLTSFIASYSQLSHLPDPQIKRHDWKKSISNLTQLFPSQEISFHFQNTIIKKLPLDLKQFEQALINLLKNAEEANLQTGKNKILIEANQSKEQLFISIKDQGIGITNPDNLFIPFYSTKKQGSGIGLVLSQQIIHNHGGQLSLKNRDDKQGAMAIIGLPI